MIEIGPNLLEAIKIISYAVAVIIGLFILSKVL